MPATAPATTSWPSRSWRRPRCARSSASWSWTRPSRARHHQRQVVAAIDEAALNWGVKVLRYEIKDLTPTEGNPARHAAADHRRARKAQPRRRRAPSFIAKSEGENRPSSIRLKARHRPSWRWRKPRPRHRAHCCRDSTAGRRASRLQLKVAERAVDAYGKGIGCSHHLIVPSNMAEVLR